MTKLKTVSQFMSELFAVCTQSEVAADMMFEVMCMFSLSC